MDKDNFQQELLSYQKSYNERILAELERQTRKIEHLEAMLNGRMAQDVEHRERLAVLTTRLDKHDKFFEQIESRLLSVDDVKDYKRVKNIGIVVLIIFGVLQAAQMIPDLIKLFARP